jgi:hypothetical protein
VTILANIEHRWLLHAPTEDAPRDRMPSVISGPRLPHGELWVVPAEQLTGAVEQVDEALKLLEARRSPSGQIPLAAEPAERVLALLRGAIGGQ